MRKGRFQSSVFNLTSGFFYRILIMLTAFVVRTVFIRCLNEDYLGINGLYSNILSMLSLAELGFGTAMVYSMYKPLAEKDSEKIAQLMHLYRKAYTIIGTAILVLGLCLIPFLDLLIKNKPDIEGLTLYYVLFLLNTVVSYWFFAYRNSLLQADQRSYVISNYNSIFNLVKSVFQIVVLLVFHNYLLYLLTQILCTICQNIALAVKVKKDYPVFKIKDAKLPKEERKHIFKDVKALMLQKVSFTVLNSTDSLIISAFVGVNWVGLLSNYTMIEEAIVGILSQVTASFSASVGNFFATEDKESGFRLFNRLEFMNFWFYGFSAIALIVLLNPFVTIWLGEHYLLGMGAVIALGCRFYVAGYMNTLSTFRSTLGLFVQGQFRPLIAAGLNIALSIGLSYPFGVAGVLAATSITRLVVNMWYTPLVIHRDGFGKSVVPFYKKYLFRITLLVAITAGMLWISKNIVFVNGVSIVSFIIMVGLTAIIPNLVFAIVFSRTDEFRYFVDLLCTRVFSKVINKLRP